MSHRRGRVLPGAALLGAGLLLLACGCGKLSPRPDPVRVRAIILNNQADGEIERGHLAEAERLYRAALAAARSIEDEPRIAINLLGLTATLRAAGRGQEAGRLLDELLAAPAGRFPLDLVAQASLQKAVIALDEGRASEAAAAAQRALSDCGRPDSCDQLATARVLLGRARLAQGDAAAAAAEAESALELARAHHVRREEANALRLSGDTALAQGAAQDALGHFAGALTLDKEMGLSSKVATDLLGLASAAQRLGRASESRSFAERALAVAMARQDESQAARARALGAGAAETEKAASAERPDPNP